MEYDGTTAAIEAWFGLGLAKAARVEQRACFACALKAERDTK
jgi:hypothetical protein